MWPFHGKAVVGIKLLELLDWAQKSFKRSEHISANGLLALPPLQRSAVWDPDQVVKVWDSVLRGLPLGAFTLQSRLDGEQGRRAGTDARNEKLPSGWDLLDGQQRTRSLLLGLYGPDSQKGNLDMRCLWLDLDAKSDRFLFSLHMTSASQPFGYKPDGSKLAPRDRMRARERFEPEDTEIWTESRRAYNHELFSGFIKAQPPLRRVGGDQEAPMPPEGYPTNWPPLPAGIDLPTERAVRPLHEILRIWTTSVGDKETALAQLVDRHHRRFGDLCQALRRFDDAEIALINASSVGQENLPILYDRIGAGGTPLSSEERLFSFYKSIRPAFHDIVRDIYEGSGRVMSPTKIAVSAIRIANALSHERRDNDHSDRPRRPDEGNRIPNVDQFAKALEQNGPDQDGVNLAGTLDELVGNGPHGRFAGAFNSLFKALRYDESHNPLGFPTVLLWRLPNDLVQVLLFWRLRTSREFDAQDNHLSRFVMFWLLCVRYEDQASNLCFRAIREMDGASLRALHDEIKKNDSLSRTLIPPSQMRDILVSQPQSINWRFLKGRTERCEQMVAELIEHWWRDETRFLPWLQRSYLASAFPDYDPTADRGDDTPYDMDHMVPKNDWWAHWTTFQGRLDPGVQFARPIETNIRWVRGELGESIGNKWLVDYGTNRRWSDSSFEAKLMCIEKDADAAPKKLLDVFPWGEREIWVNASPQGEAPATWNDVRLMSFQRAIEARAAWLYEELYTQLEFSAWTDAVPTA